MGLRDGEDGDLSTMGFTARQSGCLIEEPLDAFLPHFFELIRFPREVFFFFPFCCLEGKTAANILRSQCQEKPEGTEQVMSFLTPLFS